MKNNIKIKRIILVVLIIGSIISISKLVLDINRIKKLEVKNEKTHEVITYIDASGKFMSLKFIPLENN